MSVKKQPIMISGVEVEQGPRGELIVRFSPEVEAKMVEDPALGEAMRDFCAIVRQAMEAVKSGQHQSFPDAMEAITGNRPTPVVCHDDDDEPPRLLN